MVKELISKLKKRKTAEPLDLASEIARAAREAEVDMITDVVNQITVGVIPAEWDFVIFYMGK